MLLSSLAFTNCAHSFGRKKPEPIVETCKAFPDGAWRCHKKDDSLETREPEEMGDYIAIQIDDMEVYRNWCLRRRD